MNTEIDRLVRGFRATVMGEILHHREINGAGAVPGFVAQIRTHLARYRSKLDNMRSTDDRDITANALDAAETAINRIADAEIARATEAGCVEFAEAA